MERTQKKWWNLPISFQFPPSINSPVYHLREVKKQWAHSCSPFPWSAFTDCITDGESGVQNLMVHPGWQQGDVNFPTVMHSWKIHAQPLLSLRGENIHPVTPRCSKESNPDWTSEESTFLSHSWPHILRRVSVFLHLLILRFCHCHHRTLRASVLRGTSGIIKPNSLDCGLPKSREHGCLVQCFSPAPSTRQVYCVKKWMNE